MIKLRKFYLTDLERVMEIEKASFTDRGAYSEKLYKNLYKKYPQNFIVAENRREIMGYIVGQIKNRVLAERVGEFISLAVKPDFRRKEIGTKLSNFLIGQFKEKGVKKFFLHVRTKNIMALSFYKKIGFEISKKFKNYYRNGDDAYLMKKELGA